MAASEVPAISSNPSSALLQEMLREKKSQTQRVKKTYDFRDHQKNGMEGREIQSSPITSRDRPNAGSFSGSSSVRQVSMPRDMTLKDMEQHISKINKQNFDLKLEIFHRRQRTEVLEAKMEKFDTLKTDHEELQSINDDLLLELEKRDVELEKRSVAVQEAVNMICELEAKIEARAEADMYLSQNVTMSDGDSPFTNNVSKLTDNPLHDGRLNLRSHTVPQSKTQEDASSSRSNPLSLKSVHSQERQGTSPQRAPSPPLANSARRIPSFLRENNRSTKVLRSLYSSDGSIGRPDSIWSGLEEDEEDEGIISSPRLSVLTESGFSSIYGDSRDSDHLSARQFEVSNGLDQSNGRPSPSPSPQEKQREVRLRKWIEERNRSTTPARVSPKPSTPKPTVPDRFSSIGEVLDNVTPQDSEPISREQASTKRYSPEKPKQSPRKETRHQRRPSSPTFGGPMFGGAILPPTPGTMSTTTIAGNSSTPSIVTEKSLSDISPFPSRGYPSVFAAGRPGSSDSAFIQNVSNALAYPEDLDAMQASPSNNHSAKSYQPAQLDAVSCPPLSTSTSVTVYNGEGYATIHPSRTLSYPAPASRARRQSERQLSPMSEKSSNGSSGNWSTPTAQQDRSGRSQSSTNVTPTKQKSREMQKTTDPDQPRLVSPVTQDPQADALPKPGRSASLLSKMNKLSLSSNTNSHQSVTSRFFRRASTSQNVPTSSSTTSTTTRTRPSLSREPSLPTRPTRIRRPSSVFGANSVNGQQHLPSPLYTTSRPHHPQHNVNPNHPYHLSSMLPGGMLTSHPSSSATRYSRQRCEQRK